MNLKSIVVVALLMLSSLVQALEAVKTQPKTVILFGFYPNLVICGNLPEWKGDFGKLYGVTRAGKVVARFFDAEPRQIRAMCAAAEAAKKENAELTLVGHYETIDDLGESGQIFRVIALSMSQNLDMP